MMKKPPPPDLRLGGKERGLDGRVYPALLHGIDAAAICESPAHAGVNRDKRCATG